MGIQPVNAIARLIIVVLMTILASSAAIDLVGTGTPWLSVGFAAIAAVIVCERWTSAALCAGLAMTTIEGLVVIHGQRDPAQAGLYVAIAALMAAAFALTAGSHADNSATSQAQEPPVKPVMTSEEVSDED